MKHCKDCDVPDVLARDQVWNSDGTITVPGDKDFRMGIIEVDLFRSITAKIEAVVGPPVRNMFMEGKRKYAKHYIDNLLKGPLGFLARNTGSGRRKVYAKLTETSTNLGFGKVVLEFYEHKQNVGGTIYNPYYTPLFMGDVRAAFESVEQLHSKGECQGEGDEVKIRVERDDSKDKLEERFLYEDTDRLPGDIRFNRCGRCDAPAELQRYRWHLDKGIIMDTVANTRVFIVGLNDINSVFKELEEAIGDVIPTSVLEANREYGVTLFKRGVARDLDQLATILAVQGMGNMAHTRKGNTVTVTCKNPFNAEYMMGRALGLLEATEGRFKEPEITKARAFAEMTVRRL